MTKQVLINQIYWAPDFQNQYRFGSHVKAAADGSVVFDNPVMASGKVMMKWTSDYGYQVGRAVPQLPLLGVRQKYRLMLRYQAKPAKSVATRLTFYDLQHEKISSQDFVNENNVFTVPLGMVSYTMELINLGGTGIEFHRIEIGPAELPLGAFDDLWLQKPVTDDNGDHQPVNLLVLSSGQRAKRNYPNLRKLAGQLPVQVLMVAWQYHGNLSQEIANLLKENTADQTHLISCGPRFDDPILRVCQQDENCRGLLTNKIYVPPTTTNVLRYAWAPSQRLLKPAVAEPDWRNLFSVIHQVWGG